jgi:L-ascorbate metabolism protein UlaG (beta-lactamase superfamily)
MDRAAGHPDWVPFEESPGPGLLEELDMQPLSRSLAAALALIGAAIAPLETASADDGNGFQLLRHHSGRIIAQAPAGGVVTAIANAQPAGDRVPTNAGDLTVHPINHATLVMQWQGKTIYVDPVGGADRFGAFPDPDLILITDIHGDHLNVETVAAVAAAKTKILAPAAVAEKLPASHRAQTTVLANGDQTELLRIKVEAVPMYNLTPERQKFHTKGRGNGYVVTLGGLRVYVSGDTEDIPEMRKLKNIDVAFVCMNLPYTMDVKQAASAVLDFRPKIVYPFHYRGGGGRKSDVKLFEKLIGDDSGIEVRVRNWYP